ncbi:MAG: aminotransferase class V-fold PLP-dependent enzyme [Clostridia bacterium]|nr:aminotransferase class V-fold PLP-dependent enzyme [Clostridia bacterium]
MIYFDNAATTLKKPETVIKAVTEAMCSFGNAGRGVHGSSIDASRIIYETRSLLAELFHAESPERIAFTANSTEALNMAVKGLLSPEDHVITTELEHNSVLRPLYELEDNGLELTVINADKLGNINYDEIGQAIKNNTKAIITTHGSNLTGNLLDIEKISAIAHAHNILYIVDASQTAGVFPIDVKRMNIDVLCFTGHKALLGPQGTGGIYVRKGLDIKPLITGGSGVQTYSRTHPKEMPTALEAGTLNSHGIAGLNAALSYIKEVGMDSIREKECSLMWEFYSKAKEIDGIEIYGDFSTENRCAIVSLNVRDYDSGLVSDVLWNDYGIATRPGAHCAPLMHKALGTEKQGAVRFSFSHFNTFDEINTALSALREIASEE